MSDRVSGRPLIGVTLDAAGEGYADEPYLALRSNYCAAIAAAGGQAVLLPPDDGAIGRYLSLCDGLLLTGGMALIDAAIYGARADLDPRSRFELALIEAGLATELPMLGICRGMQLMAVAGGGRLHLDLAAVAPELGDHLRESSPAAVAHGVSIEAGSRLATLAGCAAIEVNSIHRQAVAEVAPGWRVAGRAGDGVIEAIERAEGRFCVGVQWHPEYRLNPLDDALFSALITAAGAVSAGRGACAF